jgi:hypothetical protein
MRPIDEIRAELKAAEAQLRNEKLASKEAVTIVYRYTIAPTPKRETHDRVYDSSCVFYTLNSECVNLDEANAAGYGGHEIHEGGMRYMYNKMSQMIVCSMGGGTIHVGSNWSGPDDDADVIAFGRISEFLALHPEGGDVTHIVDDFKVARSASRK